MNRPLVRIPLRGTGTVSLSKWLKWSLLFVFLVALAIIARVVQIELESSRLQAYYLSKLGRDISFTVDDGASNAIRFPVHGPYDVRLGYTSLPSFEERLSARGFSITSQASMSATLAGLAERGLFLPYQEKDQTGLLLRNADGAVLFSARYPERIYDSFEAIPPILVDTLLFIEDRTLLDPDRPNRNPALDWGRLGRAALDQSAARIKSTAQGASGGSTLATQIEKFRHSANGRTVTAPEKLRQIASASVRAYLGGAETMPARREIVVHYLNSVPLAAKAGIGEVNGIGDGLAAWYGRDFDEFNQLLMAPPSPATLDVQAVAFKQALSLMVSQRAPSHLLRPTNPDLNHLTDSYLRLLAANGIISISLRDAALAVTLTPNHRAAPPPAVTSFVTRKAITATRSQLLGLLGVDSFYNLDRLDLTATTTLNESAQQAVSARLAAATTPAGARAAGLYGADMLQDRDDPTRIAYSFTLFERHGNANLMRIQTDSVNQPFDINQGARLNLGSTAKLRTIVTYLQIISALHARYASMSVAELKLVKPDSQDELTRWALDYLSHTSDRSLRAMLDAAIERKYSASPATFQTGGGVQTFSNFNKLDNNRILTVHQAFQNSVNLVFVRMMRDIVHYEMVQVVGPTSQWINDPNVRQAYLTRFADQESRVYMERFVEKYQGRTPDEALAILLRDVRKAPPKIATVLRSVAPAAPQDWFNAQMRAALKGTSAATLPDDDLAQLYTKYGVDKFNLNDRAYIAGVHPLELWTVNYLRDHPQATLSQLQDVSRSVRLSTYSWLFKTRYHATQDRRIRRMAELQAYDKIGQSWRALGYPFASLTPSYAAAIGASGDRPDALAQLIGTIANEGRMLPPERISQLDFAIGTPYETHFAPTPPATSAVLSPELVAVVQGLLRDVVRGGSARRLAAGMTFPDGRTLAVYGKTGTGDQRFNVYARGGRLIESRKVNLSATFVFVLGDRFFGTLTAYVPEPYAARYDFTSALSVQLLKSMAPALQPLLGDERNSVVASSTQTLPPSATK